ncbi:MAG: hypothetical protein IKQ46_02450 [Bacteroidales bacterium]|nr:hypothetical protein [Bacteroidales bacterium]
MQLNTLTVLLRDGLANRMRVMASIAHFVKSGININILWLKNDALNCDFEHIFKPIRGFNITNIIHEPQMIHSMQQNPIKRLIAKIHNKAKGYDYVFTKGKTNIPKQLKPIFEKYQKVYVAMCFCLTEQEDYTIFAPSDNIVEIINKINYQNYIGIHIRRGDHIGATKKSPIKLFTEYIEQHIDKTKFYIATDSQDIKYLLTLHYGNNKILTNSFSLERNSPQGIVDAYAEMLILSKADLIIGSQFSSFDEVAAKIGNIQLIKLSE